MMINDKIGCDACEAWTDGYLDNELDTATASLVNAHLEQCPVCSNRYREAGTFLKSLRENAPRYKASEGLADEVMARLKADNKALSSKVRKPAAHRPGLFYWLAPGFSAAMAMALTLYISIPASSDRLADEVVSSHVRSLMEYHLMDVESSDKHTVKPWFTGKLDFSPPVTDFAAYDYPLVGGRLDYLEHKTVAALAYRHGKHLINVFIMPDSAEDRALNTQASRGYNIVSWTRNHMAFYAVSDMNMAELKALGQLILAAN
jgi:anti-sigma factor RsiW